MNTEIDNLVSLLSTSSDLDQRLKTISAIFSKFSLDEIKHQIELHNDNGYQGNVGNGYRIIARILFQFY